MKTIWKIPLEMTGEQVVEWAADYPVLDVLDVQIQRGVPCLWVMVETDRPLVPVRVRIVGTGHDASRVWGWGYLGTVQQNGLVWHVFVEPSQEENDNA